MDSNRTVTVSGSLSKTLDTETDMDRDLLPVDVKEVPDRPYSIRNTDESFSLVSFLSDRLKRAVAELPDEYFMLSEAEMREKVCPTSTDYALRVSFWREFEKTMWKGNGKIVCASVYGGICSDVYFYKHFITNKLKFAWMIRPMQTYHKEMEAILHRGTERLWDLIEIPVKNPKTGKYDTRNAEVLLKTIQAVENRVKGMAVQRSENKTVAVHTVTTTKATQDLESMASIEARIRQLQKEIKTTGGVLADAAIIEAQVVQEAPAQEREIVHVGKV